MQSMVVKHSTSGWNSKNYAKPVLFKADFAAFWAKKRLLSPLFGNKMLYTVIKGGCPADALVPMQMAFSEDI